MLLFGDVSPTIEKQFKLICEQSNNIIYIGWIASNLVYCYFFAADLVFFPGQHSVLWEQACASKVPCVFKRWTGMEHVNNDGNSDFIDDNSPKMIFNKIQELLFTPKYYRMKEAAESEKTSIYLYSSIAKKSLECTRASDKSGIVL